MGISIITGILTILGIIAGGIYFLRTSIKKIRELKAKLKEKRNKKSSDERRENTTMFIAMLAFEFSKLEKKDITSRHYTQARDFYMDHTALLGVEPRHIDGLFRDAKRKMREFMEEGERDV